MIAAIESRLAPLARSKSSKVSPWRICASRSRLADSVRIQRRLGNVGDVFRHHAHFDRGERRVRFDRPGRRIGQSARADRRPRGLCASAASEARAPVWRSRVFCDLIHSSTCACASARLRFARDMRRVGLAEIVAREDRFGFVRGRLQFGRRFALFGRGVGELERIERAAPSRQNRSAPSSASSKAACKAGTSALPCRRSSSSSTT